MIQYKKKIFSCEENPKIAKTVQLYFFLDGITIHEKIAIFYVLFCMYTDI